MLQAFIDFIRENDLLDPGDPVLLAVSGGLDSVVMTDLFHKANTSFAIAHCNFNLRGEESDEDEYFVKHLAGKYNAEFFVKQFDTAKYAEEQGLSIQMAARDLRYDWLEQVRQSEGFSKTATAHHLNDAIETFFINLIRGTGIAGLTGISVTFKQVIRPLLFTDRNAIVKYAEANVLNFREDSSNQQLKYLRNKIRHQLIPLLTRMNPSISSEIIDLMSRLQEIEAIYVQSIREKRGKILKKDKDQFILEKDELAGLEPLRSYLFGILSPFQYNKSQVDDIANALAQQPGKTFYSPTHELLVDRDKVIISKLSDIPGDGRIYEVNEDNRIIEEPVGLEFRKLDKDAAAITTGSEKAFIDLDKLNFPLHIRRWEKGDYFYPLGMKGKKKISDFFIDEKIPVTAKRKTWLLCSGNDVVWIIGHRLDDRYKVTPMTKKIFMVELLRNKDVM